MAGKSGKTRRKVWYEVTVTTLEGKNEIKRVSDKQAGKKFLRLWNKMVESKRRQAAAG